MHFSNIYHVFGVCWRFQHPKIRAKSSLSQHKPTIHITAQYALSPHYCTQYILLFAQFTWICLVHCISKCVVDREFNTNGFDLSMFHVFVGIVRRVIIIILMKHHAYLSMHCGYIHMCIKNNSIRVSFPLKQKHPLRAHSTAQRNPTQCKAIHTINLHLYAIDTNVSIWANSNHKCNIKSILLPKSCASDTLLHVVVVCLC